MVINDIEFNIFEFIFSVQNALVYLVFFPSLLHLREKELKITYPTIEVLNNFDYSRYLFNICKISKNIIFKKNV